MSKDLTIKDELTIREKLAIRLVILLLKLVKPFEWGHELDKALGPIEKLIGEKQS